MNASAPPTIAMTDDQLLRYSRHVLLDDIGIEVERCSGRGSERAVGHHGLRRGGVGRGETSVERRWLTE